MAGRARDLGIVLGDLPPGPLDAITDVPGVRVGHCTLIEGDGPLRVGRGPVRTGVTVVVPRAEPLWARPVFAGSHRLNGNGEMTGLAWVAESGLLTSPVAITNTHSVGVVRDALIAHEAAARPPDELFWRLPVVAETWDGVLNDINGQHVRADHVEAALAAASDGPVPEGNVGGGTGMICHGFKGGVGTASRQVVVGTRTLTVGVLVQANHGRRHRLSVAGRPVGRSIGPAEVPLPASPAPGGSGSIIAVVATDAPLLPGQLDRLAQRVGLGVARTGGVGENTSGDLFLAFSTAHGDLPPADVSSATAPTSWVEVLAPGHLDGLFDAVVESTEEAVVNALLAARTLTGRDGVTAHALPHDPLLELLR